MNKVIISFTSYPERIPGVATVLDAICAQTVLPDKTILYLAEPQFPGKRVDIDIKRYEACQLEIHWCPKDLRPYKKFYYAMKEFPDDNIITIDDDFYYSNTMLEELLKYHKKYPNTIIARRGAKITFKDNTTISNYEEWYSLFQSESPSMDNFATGCGGVLYPPHLLCDEVFNEKVFMELAPYADDLWLKIIQLLSCVPVAFSNHIFIDKAFNGGIADGLFFNHNQNGGNDRQFKALLSYYETKTGKSLISCIQKDGILLESNVFEKSIFDAKNFLSDWLNCNCKNNSFYIFGAGKIAQLFYSVIKKLGFAERIVCSFVSRISENENTEFDVRQFDKSCYDPDKIIVLCVGTKISPEIKSFLYRENVPEEKLVSLRIDIIKTLKLLDKMPLENL